MDLPHLLVSVVLTSQVELTDSSRTTSIHRHVSLGNCTALQKPSVTPALSHSLCSRVEAQGGLKAFNTIKNLGISNPNTSVAQTPVLMSLIQKLKGRWKHLWRKREPWLRKESGSLCYHVRVQDYSPSLGFYSKFS